MRTVNLGMAMALALLAGCSKATPGSGSEAVGTMDVAEQAPVGKSGGSSIAVSVPQIAYVYRYGFTLPDNGIAEVQARHIAACDKLGLARCRVLDMQNAMRDGAATGSTLKLVVDARLARAFGTSLVNMVGTAGGRASESSIAAEDLSKQIVDTEARLRSKQALAERLLTLLRTRSGPVADLVAAERGVADVQEEIDAAQSWLAEARGRVSMSTFELSYEPDGAIGGGFWKPLQSSFATMTSFFGQSLALLITLIAALLPWLVVGGAIFAAWRALRRRVRAEDQE